MDTSKNSTKKVNKTNGQVMNNQNLYVNKADLLTLNDISYLNQVI